MAVVLGLASQAALALGLGDIRVLSQPGQPLLAEIPVVSADPGELEAARVALASPATFARVGLAAPDALVSALRFDLAQDAQGRAVIRVTSDRPVQAPVVSFLVEVDWGRGRLVREYSALVDRPQTAQAANPPQINAPTAAPSSTIVRAPAPAPAMAPATPAPVPETAAAPARPQPAAPAAMRNPSPVTPAAPVSADGQLVVQRGQTLSHIAGQLAREQGNSLDQAMVALLQANPHAFVGGNIHRLRAGARLALPDAAEVAAINLAQARSLVREQRLQPATPAAPAAVAPSAPADKTASQPATEEVAAAKGARLEIAPAASGSSKAASVESGTVAGGQGDMQVSEQLRQAREDLATRDAEIAELRERVAELEKLREQQQALIELKDNEMAVASQPPAEAASPQPEAGNGLGGWLWGGGLLLVGAALVAWLARRRKPSPLPPLAAAGPQVDDDAPAAVPPAGEPSPDADADAFLAALEQARADAGPGWIRNAAGLDDVVPAAVADSAGEVIQAVASAEDEVRVDDPVDAPLTSSLAAAEALAVTEELAVEAIAPLQVDAEPEPEPEPEPLTLVDVADAADVAEAAEAVEAAIVVEPDALEVAGGIAPVAVAADADADADAEEVVQELVAAAHDVAPVLDEPADAAAATLGPWGVDLESAEAIQPMPGGRERLELAIAYLDLGDPATARTLLEEVAAAADQATRSQAQELLARLD